MRRLAALFVLLLIPVSGHAQDRFAAVEIKATHVRGSVYMLEGSGGNIGVSVGDDGILMVDDQFAPLADKIRAALAKLGDGKLQFILNTHWHSDHTGGNVEFGPGVPIIAHHNVRQRMAAGQELLGRQMEPAPHEALPVITFDDSLSIHFNGENIRVVHFPTGHTDGDSVVFFDKSNVVHMGDQLFAARFPFVDLSSGGNVLGLERNIRKILQDLPEDVILIPGHGPLSKREDLEAYQQMLADSIELVRGKVDQGKSLEEIQEEGVPEDWADWGSGWIKTGQWLEAVHKSLSAGD
ncbi:MAG: MBL fold metallo-hydrolase [Acidobacteria bacterium]|nr:MAG: MBL fold metallo-hydrolase [Acidobacteriota bacterium]